jgi:hypothetical protein
VERALCLCCRTRPHPCRRVLACVHACYLAAGLALQRSHNGDWGGDRSDEEAKRACGTARQSFIARPGNPVVHRGQNNRMLFSNSVSGYEPRNTGGALELITYFLRRFQRFVQPYRTETNTASEQLCYKGNALPFSSSRE